jgi:D-glucuronyl C5-epimerase C-terminus
MAASATPRLARTAWQTALSRGPGYEELPLGRAVDTGGYYVDYSAKTKLPAPSTAGAPIGLIQWALGWNEQTAAGSGGETTFLDACDRVLAAAERRGDALLFHYSVPVPKYRIEGRWLSAHAQGQAASAFVRAFERTGRDSWAEAARGAVEPLLTPDFGLVTTTPDGPVLEEAPSQPRSQILNGWITALWGLLDVAALGDAVATEAFEAGSDCLRRRIARYDVGWWTRYSLYPHRIADLAKPIYHRFHVTQAEVMARLTGHPELAGAAERWRRYDTAGHRILALAQKAAFVAVRR